ncbi:hypothetical protein GCM10010460_11650 [Microbacterium terrae]|nr:hypothetical protein GCM10017594_17580 [Microbacterium terrae]
MVRALWGSTHPGPTVVVTVLTLALGAAVGLEPWRIVVLTASVFAGQVSVGISNDVIDAARDRAVGRTDKPIARGDVSARTAWIAAWVTVAAALALSAILSAAMLAAHAIGLAAAWAYNAGLKSSVFSPVPFVVFFGLLPSFATLSAPDPAFAEPWAGVAGAVLGVAVHLTNVLPDLDDDARTSVRGLPHRLGARLSAVLAVLSLLVGAVVVLLGIADGDLAHIAPVTWVFFGATAIVAVLTLVQALRRPPSRTLFRLVMLAGVLLAAQLVVSGGGLAA